MARREIAPGVYSLEQKQGGWVHAFLIDAGNELLLIDTLFSLDAALIMGTISELGREPQDLKHILVTHAHRSHLGGLVTLKKATNATVWGHPWEADIIAGDRKAQRIGFVPMRPITKYWPVYYLQYGSAIGLGWTPGVNVDESLSDGARIGPLHAIAAPGHTPGHMAFRWPERGVLFCGDAIATYPFLSPGWPAFTLNTRQHRATVHQLADVAAPIIAVGHGDPITIDAAARVKDMVAAAERSGELR